MKGKDKLSKEVIDTFIEKIILYGKGKTEIVFALVISVFIIYILTHVIEWFQNYTTAKQMTEELLDFQKKIHADVK